MGLTTEQVRTLIIIERTTASISVISTLLLVSTFIFFKSFRTLSNTLIFYASFANIFANVAALIGGSALSEVNGPLCQFQGFLLEMFMQSDPMWSLAMAVNVYLVFFRRYDAIRLKRLYWVYAIICYGVPFIPAMFCLFYKTTAKGKMYGNATLWCWIDTDWAPVRIYSYYAPIWVAILITFIIYIRVGVQIFHKRSQLRAAGGSASTLPTLSGRPEPFTGLRTTEVEVTRDAMPNNVPEPPSRTHCRPAKVKKEQNYSITISATETMPSDLATPRAGTFSRRPSTMDKIKWAYTKCALLFAVSILITWVPASINRVYGLRHPTHPSFVLNVLSALVLPLQGFWNTVIYFTTSLKICKDCWASLKRRKPAAGFNKLNVIHRPAAGGREKESDSMVELSTSKSQHSTAESF